MAAFLPRYIKEMDGAQDDYNDEEAVAIYDYNMSLLRIESPEADSL